MLQRAATDSKHQRKSCPQPPGLLCLGGFLPSQAVSSAPASATPKGTQGPACSDRTAAEPLAEHESKQKQTQGVWLLLPRASLKSMVSKTVTNFYLQNGKKESKQEYNILQLSGFLAFIPSLP